MHNYIAQAIVFAIVLAIAGIKSLKLEPSDVPSSTSQKQLQALLKLQQVLQSNLLLLNIVLLILLATGDYSIFQIIGFAFIWLVVVHMLAAAARVGKHARRLALRHLISLLKLATALQPALSLLDNTRFIVTRKTDTFSSKGELLEAIRKSPGVLSKDEEQQIEALLR